MTKKSAGTVALLIVLSFDQRKKYIVSKVLRQCTWQIQNSWVGGTNYSYSINCILSLNESKKKYWLPKFRPWFLGSTIANRSYVGQINRDEYDILWKERYYSPHAYLLCLYGWTNRGKWRHEQGIQSSRSNLANIYYECTTWWNCSKSKSAVRNKANMTMVKNSKKRRRSEQIKTAQAYQ